VHERDPGHVSLARFGQEVIGPSFVPVVYEHDRHGVLGAARSRSA
jgi:hypothetical protein